MKRYNNLYDKMIDIRVINETYKIIRKNTKNKDKLYRFEQYYTINTTNVYNRIRDRNYIPGAYNIFLITEPKYRLIMSQQIGDKLINHLVASQILLPVLDKTLIDTNVATRVNKGTHYGIKKLKKYLNELKGTTVYALKFDISKYFYTIDHEVLFDMIKTKIKDKDALDIIEKILDSTNKDYVNKRIMKIKNNAIERINNSNLGENEKKSKIGDIERLPLYEKGKGLPIGNMTSQIMAVFYLSKLDHYIKEQLHVKYYIRYMDDGILLSNDKEYLKYCLSKITKELEKYKLKLNNKTQIININKEGVDFLGFHFYLKNKVMMKVRNDCKKRFKRKLKLISRGKFSSDRALAIVKSYEGHFKWGNCYKLFVDNMRKNSITIK